MSQRWTYAVIGVLLCLAAGIATAGQPIDTADGVLDRLRSNAEGVEDLDAVLTVQTYADGIVELTQRLRLSLLQPDRMRQEYLEPDYLAGNLTLVAGNQMWIYIAAIETWYEKDLAELSAAEQPWLVFRQLLRDVEDEFDDYDFELLLSEDDLYHLEGVAATEDAVYGRIELWVDPETFVPTERRLYDVDGNLLVALRVLEVEEISEAAYLARKLETYDEEGQLRSSTHYDAVAVNEGLDPSLFVRSEEPSDD